MRTLLVKEVADKVWNFIEAEGSGHQIDGYLICGEKRAIMFDTLQELTGLYQKARELTSLPIDVVISHGHGDHFGLGTQEFVDAGCKVYLNKLDRAMVANRLGKELPGGFFQDLEDGQTFDLGGRILKTMIVPGHTPAGDVLLDKEAGLVFSGDAVGSGHFWMQIGTTSLEELLEAVERLKKEVSQWGKEILILPGHRYQSPVPLGFSYLEDVEAALRGLIEGTLQGEPYTMTLRERTITCNRLAYGGLREFLYDPQKIKKA